MLTVVLHAVYALAAHHALDLSTIIDAWGARCGAVYLMRLFVLHLGRTAALKRILAPPPAPPVGPRRRGGQVRPRLRVPPRTRR